MVFIDIIALRICYMDNMIFRTQPLKLVLIFFNYNLIE